MVFEAVGENVSSALLLGFVIFLIWYMWNRRPSGLPPFPATPIPIVGNLLSMEKDPRNLFAKWRKKYGDIFSLYMGSQLVIVLNGFECVKEAFVTNADMFSDRPNILMFTQALRGRGIIAASGARWKSRRTLSLKILREFGFGRSILEEGILTEVENLLKFFESKKGNKNNFGQIYNISTSNILCSMVFGHRFEYDDSNFQDCCKAINDTIAGVSNTGLGNFFPFLQYFPGDLAGIKKLMRSVECFEDKLIKPEVERHFKEYDGTTDDFIAAYIKEIKDREAAGDDTTDLRENLTQIVSDLFIAGTETTATTLKWLILYLIHFPEVQEKCFEEIKENIGLSRLPALKDKASVPYVEATFAETQRLANIAPLGFLHSVPNSTTFRGFHFPKGVAVMPNMHSVHMDPKVWKTPEKFQPERFLDEEGKFLKREELIPFSIGRRVCLGEGLAKMELFLLGTSLIQRFHFQQPEDEPLPSLEPVLSAAAMPLPYKVKAVLRI